MQSGSEITVERHATLRDQKVGWETKTEKNLTHHTQHLKVVKAGKNSMRKETWDQNQEN